MPGYKVLQRYSAADKELTAFKTAGGALGKKQLTTALKYRKILMVIVPDL